MAVVNAVVQYANDNAFTRDSFTPDRNDVDVIADCSSSLTVVCLNTETNSV